MSDIAKVCAWCKRVLVNGEWVVPPSGQDLGQVTHGICEECEQRVTDDLDEDESALNRHLFNREMAQEIKRNNQR